MLLQCPKGMVSEVTMYLDIVSPQFHDFLLGAVLVRPKEESPVAFLDSGANLFGFSPSFLALFPSADVDMLRSCCMDAFLPQIQ